MPGANTNQVSEHDVNEPDVTTFLFDRKTGNDMPTGMSIMTLAPLALLDRTFHFQPVHNVTIGRFTYKIGISLAVIMFIRGEARKGICQNIGDNPAEIITLNIGRQWPRHRLKQSRVDKSHNFVSLVQRRLNMRLRQTWRKLNIRNEAIGLNRWNRPLVCIGALHQCIQPKPKRLRYRLQNPDGKVLFAVLQG